MLIQNAIYTRTTLAKAEIDITVRDIQDVILFFWKITSTVLAIKDVITYAIAV